MAGRRYPCLWGRGYASGGNFARATLARVGATATRRSKADATVVVRRGLGRQLAPRFSTTGARGYREDGVCS